MQMRCGALLLLAELIGVVISLLGIVYRKNIILAFRPFNWQTLQNDGSLIPSDVLES
jgi:hypothetical protein